jgi:hypothetical protein
MDEKRRKQLRTVLYVAWALTAAWWLYRLWEDDFGRSALTVGAAAFGLMLLVTFAALYVSGALRKPPA